MSTTMKVGLALTLFVCSSWVAMAANNHHGKAIHRAHGQKVQQQHAPPNAQSRNSGCVSDEGGGRIHPCGEGGGGGGAPSALIVVFGGVPGPGRATCSSIERPLPTSPG